MDVYEAIRTRRSIRKYLDVPVPKELVSKIVDAGRFAPSSGNLQNWKFILVEDDGLKRAIADASMQQYWMESAHGYIIPIAEPDKAKRFYGLRGERLYTIQNLAAATQNMLLTAHSLGLGACWVGAFDEDKVSRLLKIPEEYRPQAIIVFGYPDEDPDEQQKYPIEILMYFNGWRARVEDVGAYLGFHSEKVVKTLNQGAELIQKGISKIEEKGKEALDKLKKKNSETKKEESH